MNNTATADNIVLEGIPASHGVAIGKVWVSREKRIDTRVRQVEQSGVPQEVKKFDESVQAEEEALQELADNYEESDVRDIIETQIQILHDPDLQTTIRKNIEKELFSADYSVFLAFNEYLKLLENSNHLWVRDRSIDIISLRDKLIRRITGDHGQESLPLNSVVFADDLSPTDVIELYQAKAEAILMLRGGTTSHAVIIAQSLGLPCIISVNWRNTGIRNNMEVAVDAEKGDIIINPDQHSVQDFKSRLENYKQRKQEAVELSVQPNETSCGTVFSIFANVEFEEELPNVVLYGADGIGLLRTETLFLQQGYFDTEDHISFYSTFLEGTGESQVVIRLLDIGGDKLPGNEIDELNPFLGWRGIRMLLDEKELLHRQIRAIYRAAVTYPGRIKILVPMITDLSELDELQAEIVEVRKNLRDEKIPCGEDIPVGIMVEVPAIALQAKKIAGKVDFFSIGSNDLTQYTLAADRGNERVSARYQNCHPAVWQLIQMTYEAAAAADIPIHVCGEIAGKPLFAAALVGMGIRSLSMNPASIPQVKKVLCNHSVSDFRELVDGILNSSDGKEAEQVLKIWETKYLEQ